MHYKYYSCPSHCCPVHGCKYGYAKCPVSIKKVVPQFPKNNGCELCEASPPVGPLWTPEIGALAASLDGAEGAISVPPKLAQKIADDLLRLRAALAVIEDKRKAGVDAAAWQPIEQSSGDTKWRCWYCHAIVYRNYYPTFHRSSSSAHTPECSRYESL